MKTPIAANDNAPRNKLLRFPKLESEFGLEYTQRHIRRLEADGKFPRSIKIGAHVYWRENDIADFINKQAAA